MPLASHHDARLARAQLALTGLSVGDAFGESMVGNPQGLRERRISSERPWPWTDDTAMAMSIVEALAAHGDIDADDLAARFAARYQRDPRRGYGGGARKILTAIADGKPWAAASGGAFHGGGSMGNGAAMRVAPLGAWFADDAELAVAAAARSAAPTHAHPDGVAGGIAVAVAATITAAMGAGLRAREGRMLISEVLLRTPPGYTHDAIRRVAHFPLDADPVTVATAVGNGSRVVASDTVPFCLWATARHLDDYAEALWTTCSVGGDIDTTCAIVGGLVVLSAGSASIPPEWLAIREPL